MCLPGVYLGLEGVPIPQYCGPGIQRRGALEPWGMRLEVVWARKGWVEVALRASASICQVSSNRDQGMLRRSFEHQWP